MLDTLMIPLAEEVGRKKHRLPGETFEDAMNRIATALADDDEHRKALLEILLDRRFLPGGRIQASVGSPRKTTAFNCFVSGTIPDSMDGIFDRLKEAALTMQKGGGIGYDFSTIRPEGAEVKGVQSYASGPISFMRVFDAMCLTIMSAGTRRGAMMGVLRVDHPDIEKFVEAKTNSTELRNFNVSVAVTDEFMMAVERKELFPLQFEGQVYKMIDAAALWNKIMEATWDWAEPGVIFIDRINEMNNLWYCETIASTNPCAEQPLPPFGACLLGSFNWTRYVCNGIWNMDLFKKDIPVIVRAMDNVVDRTIYPLPQQEKEAMEKRRMGLGVTGLANAIEALGFRYGTEEALFMVETIMRVFTNECYRASVELSKEKGPFPKFHPDFYLMGKFIQKLDEDVQEGIRTHGIRNSHLTSIAPAGTISVAAGNVSSSLEPPYLLEYERTVLGLGTERVTDYAYRVWGIEGVTADKLTPNQHVDMLITAQKWIDSACSKTCNVGDDVTFEEFKDVYMRAWKGGAKGCTTFRAAGKRYGILNKVEEKEGAACYIGEDGKRTCE